MATSLVVHETPSLADYIAGLNPTALQHQQALAAAYDAACAALVGPNDVQKDGGRSFKKKSAWRKLARHFGISVDCELADTRVDFTADGFIAYARAKASAPWGQSWADVGACSSDEATGKRTITYADAIATAMTRASNRAVSNLIAMGEVSAEEIGNRAAYGAAYGNDAPARSSAPSNGPPKGDAEKKWPFGEKKGTPLGAFTTEELEKMLKWCREKKKTDIADAIGSVLADRSLGGHAPEADRDEPLDDLGVEGDLF